VDGRKFHYRRPHGYAPFIALAFCLATKWTKI